MTFDEANQVNLACLEHARNLLGEAEQLLKSSPHLAFHLTTLALEEIGKSVQTFVELNRIPEPSGNAPRFLSTDDHVQKLFWALWDPSLNTGTMNPDHMKWCLDFAKKTHELRLSALYVDWKDGKISVPRETVKQPQARQLLDVAQARLNLAQLEKKTELDDERKGLLLWFSTIALDEEQSNRLFTQKSLSMLTQFTNFPDWIRWLRSDWERADEQAKETLNKELQRTEPDGEARGLPKWKVKIRLFTTSHSIRQAELNWANGQMRDFIRLDRGKNSQEVFLTIALPNTISLPNLWHVAWLESRRFVCAMNIGSLGFIWWQIPVDVSRYYIKMLDLETNYEVKLERNPRLTLAWGNRVLDQAALFHTLLVYRFLPRRNDGTEPNLLGHYINGLAFLGKNDVHLRVEPYALAGFYEAFRIALQQFNDWDGACDFGASCKAMFDREFPGMSDWVEIINLAERLRDQKSPEKEITLTHATGMKLYCDTYLLKKLKLAAEQEKKGDIEL